MSQSGNPATPAAGASSVRRRPVLALLGADAVSQTGNVLTNLAVPWFVLETTGSPARTGVTLFVTALPNVIAGFFGGTLVDRTGYKRMSILSDLTSGVTVALIPLLYHIPGWRSGSCSCSSSPARCWTRWAPRRAARSCRTCRRWHRCRWSGRTPPRSRSRVARGWWELRWRGC